MKLGWRGALGIVLSVVLLVWTLRDVDPDVVWRTLAASNMPLLLLSVVVATTTFPLRARRWRTILDPIEPGIPFAPLWQATAIGMMVNNVVPARAGEIARAYALTRSVPSVPLPAAIASIAVDRLFDAVVVLLLMFVAMLDPVFPPGATVAGRPAAHLVGGSGTLFIVVLFAALYTIVFFPARIVGVFSALAGRISPRLEARGRDALLAFAAGLSVLRSPRRFAAVFAWTLLHWLVAALGFYIGFLAVGVDVPFSAALFLQGLIAIGVAIPAAPGFFGVFEKLAQVGLGVYGVDASLAVSWAIGFHILSFIPITVIGAVYFTRMGLGFREIAGAAGTRPGSTAADDDVPRKSDRRP